MITLTKPQSDQAGDPVFQQEQDHLSDTYAKLEAIAKTLSEKMERRRWQAAKDKDDMQGEVKHNFASDGEAQETYVDYAVLNNLIRDYNLEQDADSERLAAAAKLLEQPYFAKISLEMRTGAPAKDIYIGLAGVADENYRRMVVDWRSPVAEVYYNQENGATSYEANGRTVKVNLLNRRQFDIEGKTLRAYFDSDVAIEDSLLLQSLSAQRSEHMKAITATIQKEQNLIIRHEDVPALLVAGIAGSGKTSVLLQRIAYLFYRNRGSLDPRQVFLISPNPVFAKYIENVLPDLGERNPETITYHDLCARLLPAGRNPQDKESPLELLWRIDNAVEGLRFELADLRDIKFYGVRLVSAGAIMQLMQKYPNVPAGPHLVTLGARGAVQPLRRAPEADGRHRSGAGRAVCACRLTSRCACSTRRTTRKPSRRHATARSRTCRNASRARCLPSSATSGCASTASACACSAWRTCPSAHGCT